MQEDAGTVISFPGGSIYRQLAAHIQKNSTDNILIL